MVYLLAALANYRQLVRLRAEELPAIERELAARMETRPLRLAWSGEGIALAAFGQEGSVGEAAVAEASFAALALLRSLRNGLFGFNLLLDVRSAGEPGEVASQLADQALRLQPDEELWLSPEAGRRYGGLFSLESRQGNLRVLGPGTGSPVAAPHGLGSRPLKIPHWVREALVDRSLDLLAPALNGDERVVLHLHGPSGSGKTALVRELAHRLCGNRAPFLRTWAMFRRRTPLHPFLNSVDEGMLAQVPRYLREHERRVWGDLGGLFSSLARETRDCSPDHLAEDFFLAYTLYARAWARRCDEALVPALIACEGVDSYHPVARAWVARLLEDLAGIDTVLEVVTSCRTAPPEELSGLPIASLAVHPLGRREIRSLARHQFPGLELPEAVVRMLRRRSDGRYPSAAAYLSYLAHTGHIRATVDGHRWLPEVDGEAARLPADPTSVSWYLAGSLADDAFLLLYALYLASGLLDRDGLVAFLSGEGFDPGSLDRSARDFVEFGLIADEDSLVPRFPRLRRKLEQLLGQEAVRLRARLTDWLMGLWERGTYSREVLLYTFLARSGRTDLALRILPGIIRRKLDERDIAGARAFCAPASWAGNRAARPELAAGRERSERDHLALIAAIGKLRAAVLENRLEEAAEHVREIGASQHAVSASDAFGSEVALALAGYFLSAGDTASALEEAKRALMASQELGLRRAERESYLLLGVITLADGRVGDAVEYCALCEHHSSAAGDRLLALRAECFLAICSFLEGRLDQVAEATASARSAAAALGQRGMETFLAFLDARSQFQLGRYHECALALERCLCLVELYGPPEAEAVMDAWLARTLVYEGLTLEGSARLERVEQRREVLVFRAEAALFTGDDAEALSHIQHALAIPAASRFPPFEGERWWDGCAAVEGRSFGLARGEAYLQRWLIAMRAYLLTRSASVQGAAVAAHDLGELARSVRPTDLDPSGHLYQFLYACILPEESTGEADDKGTVLGKALKALQERAGRIGEPAQRASFLSGNRWNRLLMEEARGRRLA